MKIYEWSFKGQTGTVNANNTKEAKTMLAVQLRKPGDKSSRIPKGTKIKKIGLTKGNNKPSVLATKIEPEDKPAEKQARCRQVAEVVYETLTKNTVFSNCIVRIANGTESHMHYIADGCELHVKKGARCCKVVGW